MQAVNGRRRWWIPECNNVLLAGDGKVWRNRRDFVAFEKQQADLRCNIFEFGIRVNFYIDQAYSVSHKNLANMRWGKFLKYDSDGGVDACIKICIPDQTFFIKYAGHEQVL